MSERRKYNVTVLHRREVTVFPKLNVAEVQMLVTYVAAGLPPSTVTIVKKDYTMIKEKALIKKDIEKRLKEKPESYVL